MKTDARSPCTKPTPRSIAIAIEQALGDGELTPEVQGTIAVAKELVRRAWFAGIAEGRRRERGIV